MIDSFKHIVNVLSAPQITFPIMALLFFLVFPPTERLARWNKKLHLDALWTNKGGIILHAILFMSFVFGAFDPNFRAIIGKPDNVPIILLLFSAVFFLWLAMKQATENDKRIESGEKPAEYSDPKKPKILVWPDLVYIELISMVLCMAGLIIWSICLQAPLEEPADPTLSPNPAKAPWYFLGLQEMLVYFDPWLAGVVLPTLIVVGLMAIPYLDNDRSTAGYYSFANRRLFISLFLFGWLLLWVYLIIIGAFMRGPNWNFFGPFEKWDVHKIVPLTNIDLSSIIWVKLLHRPLPDHVVIREIFGLLALFIHFLVLPPLLAKTWLKNFSANLGNLKYAVFMFLSMAAVGLPIKMLLRLTLNLKYIITIPGWFNI